MNKAIITLMLVLSTSAALAQNASTAKPRAAKSVTAIEKSLISVEYNSWVEKLSVSSASGATDYKATYYGFGLGFEKNFYYPKWGWGIGGGFASGSAIGGDKNVGLKYFQARVPWTTLRISPRVFWRFGPKVDMGFSLSSYIKNADWPTGDSGEYTVQSGSKMITGGFVDLRARISNSLEFMQSFGSVYKDETMYWRLGLAYRM
ncbi:hypothetical protein [Bdellovibrio sp. HCB209]|uniref:hypothetical protein n=1 Tax=Bdellovibrio sp. HCB209 TaxID=3394354 RepID=UPI0039B46AFA